MKKLNLSKKGPDVIFEVVHMWGDNGEIEGHFETIAEAKREAIDSKERYFANDKFEIYEMVWSDSEGEYVNQYDETGCLLDPVEVI